MNNLQLIRKIYIIFSILSLFFITHSKSESQDCNQCEETIPWSDSFGIDINLSDVSQGFMTSACQCSVRVDYKVRHGKCLADSIWEIKIVNIVFGSDCLSLPGCSMTTLWQSITKILLLKSWVSGADNLFTSHGYAKPDYPDAWTEFIDPIRIRIPACWKFTYYKGRLIPCDENLCCLYEYTATAPDQKVHVDPYDYYGFNYALILNSVTQLISADDCDEEACFSVCDGLYLTTMPLTVLGYFYEGGWDKKMYSSVNNSKENIINLFFNSTTNSIIIKSDIFLENNNKYILSIFDILGRCVYFKDISGIHFGIITFEIPALLKGVYYARLLNNCNYEISKSLIVKY